MLDNFLADCKVDLLGHFSFSTILIHRHGDSQVSANGFKRGKGQVLLAALY